MKMDYYNLGVPGHCRFKAERAILNVAAAPAHEVLAKEIAELRDFSRI